VTVLRTSVEGKFLVGKKNWTEIDRVAFAIATILCETDGNENKVASAVDAVVRLAAEPRPRVKFSVPWMMRKFGTRVRVTWSTDGTAERCRDQLNLWCIRVFYSFLNIAPEDFRRYVRISNSCSIHYTRGNLLSENILLYSHIINDQKHIQYAFFLFLSRCKIFHGIRF